MHVLCAGMKAASDVYSRVGAQLCGWLYSWWLYSHRARMHCQPWQGGCAQQGTDCQQLDLAEAKSIEHAPIQPLCAGVLLVCVLMQAIAQFCLLAVVGMLLGIACGISTSWLLEHIFR